MRNTEGKKDLIIHDGIRISSLLQERDDGDGFKLMEVLFSNPDKNSEVAGISISLNLWTTKPGSNITAELVLNVGDKNSSSQCDEVQSLRNITSKIKDLGNFQDKKDNASQDIRGLLNYSDKDCEFLASTQGKTSDDYKTYALIYQSADLLDGAKNSFPEFLKLLCDHKVISDDSKISEAMCGAIVNTMQKLLIKSTGQLQETNVRLK